MSHYISIYVNLFVLCFLFSPKKKTDKVPLHWFSVCAKLLELLSCKISPHKCLQHYHSGSLSFILLASEPYTCISLYKKHHPIEICWWGFLFFTTCKMCSARTKCAQNGLNVRVGNVCVRGICAEDEHNMHAHVNTQAYITMIITYYHHNNYTHKHILQKNQLLITITTATIIHTNTFY